MLASVDRLSNTAWTFYLYLEDYPNDTPYYDCQNSAAKAADLELERLGYVELSPKLLLMT